MPRTSINTARRVVTVKELAEILGCHASTIYRLIRSGDLKPTIRLGADYRFDPDDALRQLRERELSNVQ